MLTWLVILSVLVILLGAFIMFNIPQINQRLTDLNSKLDTAIANQGTPPPPVVATQADLDAIGAAIETANAKADTLLAPPPAP